MADLAGALVDAGADILHCSQRRFWEPEFPEIDGSDVLNFAGWAKKLTGAPTITVGSVGLSGEFVAAFAGEGSKPAFAGRTALCRLDRWSTSTSSPSAAPCCRIPNGSVKVHQGRNDDLQDFSREHLAVLA